MPTKTASWWVVANVRWPRMLVGSRASRARVAQTGGGVTPQPLTLTGYAVPRPPTWRRIVSAVGLSVGLLLCVVLALDVLAPGTVPDGIRAWMHDNRWAPLAIVVAMLPVGLGLPGGRGPLTGRRTAFLWPTVLAVIALVLGLVSYLPHAGQEAPVFAPLFWTLALFAGNVQVFWGGDAAVSEPPLALELARLAALSATLFTAVEIAMRLSSQRLGRLRLLGDHRRIVVVGLSSDTLPVLRSVARTMSPGALLVVLDNGIDEVAISEAAALGAVIVPGPVSDARLAQACVRRHLRRSRTIKASQVFVLHPQMQDAIDVARAVEATLSGATLEAGFICRLMVRIDDPWTAEAWRRERATEVRPWLTDALSGFEQTARRVVALTGYVGGSPLLIVGRSRLALSVLAEVAHQGRVARLPGPGGLVPEPRDAGVVVAGPEAVELVQDAEIFQRRFGGAGFTPEVVSTSSSCPGGVSFTEIEDILKSHRGAAVVLARAPGDGDLEMGARLAAAYPMSIVISWEGDATGVPAVPAVGNLYRIGLSLNDLGGNPPRDNWSRLAELAHDHYRAISPAPEVPRVVDEPWDRLPVLFQESNVRQLGLLFSSVTLPEVDRTWAGPPATEVLPWSDAEVAVLAQAEHESWCAYYRAHGWTHRPGLPPGEGRPKDWRLRYDEKLWAPNLEPWDDLGPERQAQNCAFVRGALERLPLLGYAATPAFHEYERVGVVRATRLSAPRPWSWEGQPMQAEAGDWWVEDDAGGGRSVKPDSFAKTYRHIGEDMFERCGTVRARRAIAGEVIVSSEGSTEAHEGDMVITADGVSWVSGKGPFEAGYRLAVGDRD
jgi:hypothetical protein